MEFTTDDSINKILTKLLSQDEDVNILLNSGTMISGNIKKVGTHLTVVSLSGNKSFYDAYVKISDISSVEVKVRE